MGLLLGSIFRPEEVVGPDAWHGSMPDDDAENVGRDAVRVVLDVLVLGVREDVSDAFECAARTKASQNHLQDLK
jgi:hypothetical protein